MRVKASQIFADFKDSEVIDEMRGPDCELGGIAPVQNFTSQDLVFISSKRYLKVLIDTEEKRPAAAVVSRDLAQELGEQGIKTLLISPNVNLAQALLKQKYADHDFFNRGWPRIHPSAVLHESVKVPESAHIGPMAVIEKNVKIEERVMVGAGSVLEQGAVIGEGTIIHPKVFVGYNCMLGKDVMVKPGTIIGSEGFGFAQDKQRKNHRIPQTGRVRIGDRVIIGALNTIDRGAYGDTYIADGVVTDDHCHIAHNCQIDADSIFIAYAGVGGSTKIGKRSIIGGRTSIADNLSIFDDTILLHCAAVAQSIQKPGAYAGAPLQPLRDHMRSLKHIKDLPKLYKELKDLERKVESLSKKENVP